MTVDQEAGQEIYEYSRRGMLSDLEEVISKTHPDTFMGYDGSTAFLMACKSGHVRICELLVQHNADIFARTDDGSSGLLLAVATGNLALVELLSKLCPSDINSRNEDGFTPLDIAEYYKNPEIVQFLKSVGGVSSSGAVAAAVEFCGPSEKWGYGVFDEHS